MGQFYDEDKIKAMESAAGSAPAPQTPPATPASSPAPAPASGSGHGHFYDEDKIKAMQGGGSPPSPAQSQKLATYALVALIAVVVLGMLWWKAKHNPDTMIVDINRSRVSELSYLPGIGPAKAQVIIDHRPYTTIDDLKKVPGIGEKTFEKLKPRVKVE